MNMRLSKNGVDNYFCLLSLSVSLLSIADPGIVDNWGDAANPWFAGNVSVPDVSGPSKADQDWRVSAGMNLFTKLGLIDLVVNYGP